MKGRFVSALLLGSLCLSLNLSGCNKDRAVAGFDRLLHEAGELLLTQESRLTGDRDFGIDCYVGSYEGDYRDFDGFETLFGGVGLERAAGDSVTLHCTLTLTGGEARLVFRCGAEEDEILLDGAGEVTRTLTLPAGGNYICLVGEDFTGSIHLEIA